MNCSLSTTNLKIFGRAVYSLARLPGDELYFDAQTEGLFLRTLNSSRSAFCCFKFSPLFFLTYVPSIASSSTEENLDDATNENRCKIPAKSALIIYKIISNLEKTIESCDIKIDVNECRLVFRLNCKNGVVRIYNFILIECDTVETLYDRTQCEIQLVAPATLLLDAIQTNFKGGLEDLTLNARETELLLTNCLDDEPDPDKCVKTLMRLNADEFDKFLVRKSAEVTFCLKELRAFLAFIEIFRLPVSIYFDQSGKPVIFALESDPNFTSELILASYLVQDAGVKCDQVASQATTSAAASERPIKDTLNASSQRGNKIYRRKHADSIRVSDTNTQLLQKVSTQSQANAASKSRISNNNTQAIDKITASRLDHCGINQVVEESPFTIEPMVVEDDIDVLPPSPPPKKPRHFLLIKGWSQNTIVHSHTSTMNGDHDSVLAPDSDLEDH